MVFQEGSPNAAYANNKALFGILRAALLFYCKLHVDLEEIRFAVKPSTIAWPTGMSLGAGVLTVVWHVDDLKVSHKDEAVVTNFARELGLATRTN